MYMHEYKPIYAVNSGKMHVHKQKLIRKTSVMEGNFKESTIVPFGASVSKYR